MIRTDIKDFPFGNATKSVRFILIGFEQRSVVEYVLVDEKKKLVSDLEHLIKTIPEFILIGNNNIPFGRSPFRLLAFWHGEWSTDCFEIGIIEGYSELKKHWK